MDEEKKETIEERKEDDRDARYDDELEAMRKRISDLEIERDDYREKYENEQREREKIGSEFEGYKSATKEAFWRSTSEEAKEQQNDDVEDDNEAPYKSYDELIKEGSAY